jgi:hypothetical protein
VNARMPWQKIFKSLDLDTVASPLDHRASKKIPILINLYFVRFIALKLYYFIFGQSNAFISKYSFRVKYFTNLVYLSKIFFSSFACLSAIFCTSSKIPHSVMVLMTWFFFLGKYFLPTVSFLR